MQYNSFHDIESGSFENLVSLNHFSYFSRLIINGNSPNQNTPAKQDS